jgi:ribosomal protein S18 acetylase RimI-like enzyme
MSPSDPRLASFCNQIAAMETWKRLKVDGSILFQRNSTDPDREIWYWQSGEMTAAQGVIIFRRKDASEYLKKLGFAESGPTSYVHLLAVFPGSQNRGIGAKLLAHAEEAASHGSSVMSLCVSEWNENARRFYENYAYRPAGRSENCIIQGNTEILMRKPLSGSEADK